MISVADWVTNAFESANSIQDVDGTLGLVHRDRSRRFVEALGCYARQNLTSKSERVLTKHYSGSRDEFGLNELLYDVLWCDTKTTSAAQATAQLRFVTKGLWAVESEFAQDSRQALFDFNKLVLANTEAKLFIGPLTNNWQAYIAPLASAAKNVKGDLFVALVSRPSAWKTPQEQKPIVFRWINGKWEPEEPKIA